MVSGKHVLIFAASVTTGYTAQAAVETVKYYGGMATGICFASVDACTGYPVYSVFNTNDLGDYKSYPSRECPMCKNGEKIDVLANGFGFSML